MRVSELQGLPVIDPYAARRVGTVSGVVIDPASCRIVALDLSTATEADAAARQRIAAGHVQRVGRHAVMLRSGALAPRPTLALPPEPGWLDIDEIVGLEVLNQAGDRLGQLGDVHFNAETLEVEGYNLAVGKMEKWFGGGGRIATEAVVACSADLMVVRAGKAPEVEVEAAPQAGRGTPEPAVADRRAA